MFWLALIAGIGLIAYAGLGALVRIEPPTEWTEI